MKLCIALHDVAPATWPQCQLLLRMLDELNAAPFTLLVVPDFHRRGRVDQSVELRRELDAQQRRGNEIALHGFVHLDEAPAPRDIGEWLRRRALTAGEGEFAALDERGAAARIAAGRDMFAAAGWQVDGFVPPAWLAGPAAMDAIRCSGLEYTSDHHGLVDLRQNQRIPAPVLTASARSAWRRAVSRIWLESALIATQRAAIVRVGLHPEDARHRTTMQQWKSILQRLLQRRTPMTKAQALRDDRCARAKPC